MITVVGGAGIGKQKNVASSAFTPGVVAAGTTMP